MEVSVEQSFPPPLAMRSTERVGGKWALTRTQWISLVLLAFGNLGLAICSGLQAPFFPREAEKKGTTPSEYGLVFGLFYLTNFIFAPIFGKLIPITGPDFLRDSGMFVVGVCFVLFGFLDMSPPGVTFLSLAYVIRIMEGVGSAAYKTSNFAIIAASFPEQMATAMGVLETMFGLGLIIGPTIGGLLFELGGFALPFVLSGSILTVLTIVSIFALPKTALKTLEQKPLSPCKFLGDPLVVLYVFLLTLGSLCVGFNQVTLEPHLRQFNLSPVGVGMMFIFSGGFYSLASSVFGLLTDRKFNATCLTTVSCLFLAVGFTFIGPVPYLPFDCKLWMVGLSLVLFGIGFGGTRVVSFLDCLQHGLSRGYDNNMATYGLVSGVFNAAFGIGYFIGPTIGGVCLEHFGYRNTTAVISSLGYLLGFCFVVHLICERRKRREKQPLLRTNLKANGLANGGPQCANEGLRENLEGANGHANAGSVISAIQDTRAGQ